MRELNKLEAFTYVPPFRGRAIRMIRRDCPSTQLEIDFEALERRKAAEYEKLNRVIRFALSGSLPAAGDPRYFGDAPGGSCGHCDNCDRRGPVGAMSDATGKDTSPKPKRGSKDDPSLGLRASGEAGLDEKVRTALRMVLAGVARAQSRVRCGKNLIAQMLCGSSSSRLAKLGFHRLSTFGLLKHLTQPDVAMLVDALIATGHLEQVDLEPNRPVVQLTPSGTELMKAEGEVHVNVPIPAALLAKLRGEPARTARRAIGLSSSADKTRRRRDAEGGAVGASAGLPSSVNGGLVGEPDPFDLANESLSDVGLAPPATPDAWLAQAATPGGRKTGSAQTTSGPGDWSRPDSRRPSVK